MLQAIAEDMTPAPLLSQQPVRIGIGRRLAYHVYLRVVSVIRTSRTVYRLLFGYTPQHTTSSTAPYWDWVTIALCRAMSAHLQPDAKFLDVGTGIVAVLPIVARHRYNCQRVVAAEVVPEVLALARSAGTHAGGGIEFVCSDLLENVSGRFDVITFNAPYLDADRAGQFGLLENELSRRRFSGGPGGYDTIRRFLQDAADWLTPTGVALLGVNHYHAAPATLQALIQGSRLRLRERRPLRGTGAVVYVLSGS